MRLPVVGLTQGQDLLSDNWQEFLLSPEGSNQQRTIALRFPLFFVRAFLRPLDHFGKKIEAQRARSLMKIDILTVKLIALHKLLVV
jgi:hypothetical protein